MYTAAHVDGCRYKLTPMSLYAAASMGLSTREIIDYLNRLCKTELPTVVVDFITDCTASFGKVQGDRRGFLVFIFNVDFGQARLVLKNNRYYIQAASASIMQQIIKLEVVAKAIALAAEKAEAAATTAGPVGGARVQSTAPVAPAPVKAAPAVAAAASAGPTDAEMLAAAELAEANIPADLRECVSLIF
jgi:DNA excision repair protein ERCC-3